MHYVYFYSNSCFTQSCSHYIMHKLLCLLSNKTDMQKMSSKYFKQQNPKKLRIYSSQGNFI